MKDIFEFFMAALPWLSIGLLFAIFAVREKQKKDHPEKEDNYGYEGMALGMCFGTAIGTALGNNTGIGISLGMLLGLVVGSGIKKEEQGDDKKE